MVKKETTHTTRFFTSESLVFLSILNEDLEKAQRRLKHKKIYIVCKVTMHTWNTGVRKFGLGT